MSDSFVQTVPIFINTRDRLSCLLQLLAWLEHAGHRNMILIDNASTYPPLVAFLDSSPYRVVRLKRNIGHSALWKIRELRETIRENWFVYTDPDVVPTEECPLNLVVHLRQLLAKYPNYLKAGPALRVSDVPNHYHLRQRVIDHELSLYGREVEHNVFHADIDTTFALHRPATPYLLGPAIRVRGEYEAVHLPWYANSDNPDDEELYYRAHASSDVTNWNNSGEDGIKPPPPTGGVATQIEVDSQAMLDEILHSKFGKTLSLIWAVRRLLGQHSRWRVRPNGATASESQKMILEILQSHDWRLAFDIVDPIKNWVEKHQQALFSRTGVLSRNNHKH